MENKKVLLGMSGGVDSSVSALILKEQGYDVIGITLELFSNSCSDNKTSKEAKELCEKMRIPHITYEQKEKFKKCVIDHFISEYSKQRTPNPCIECNKYLKFGAMYEKAKELGCEYIATGHYARMVYSEEFNRYAIKKAKCIAKDQSYVLYSEDICFIPDGDYVKFLETNSNLKPKKGKIVTKNGTVLGEHKGLYKYTIGQRKGLGISYKAPLYVIGFNKERNEVIVGEKEEIYSTSMLVNNINLLLVDEIQDKMRVAVKTRYSSKEEMATIEMKGTDLIEVTFDNPVARITPGQSAVFYIEDLVLGGGKIKEAT